jgi:hypothetical protein
MPPRFILSTLKCNNVTPKALKLHLQSIKLQKSIYSLNFFYFTCAMMSRFAKFQVFFSSTILIPSYSGSCQLLLFCPGHVRSHSYPEETILADGEIVEFLAMSVHSTV